MFFSDKKLEEKYLKVALPAAMESVFVAILASADLIMVGSLGTASIAAVSIFLQPRLVLLCVVRSLASALTLVTAQKVGAKTPKEAESLLQKTIVIGAIVIGILHIMFFYGLGSILTLMGASQEYLTLGVEYASIALIGVFITSLTLILQAAQLGHGATSAIMKNNLLGNVVNVIFNALLIFGLGPFPKLGIKGAAIGTVIGTLLTFVLTIIMMYRDKYFGKKLDLWPDKNYLAEIGHVFVSVFTEQGSERLGMVLFARMIAGLGTIPFAVYSIGMNICDYYFDFATGLGKANMVLAGHARGANNIELWQRYKRLGFKWEIIFSTICFIITAVFARQIFGVYTTDEAVLTYSVPIMLIVAFLGYPQTHALICAGILRGSGKARVVAVYSFVLIALLRPAMTAVFLYIFNWGLLGAWLAVVLDQCFRSSFAHYFLVRLEKEITSLTAKVC